MRVSVCRRSGGSLCVCVSRERATRIASRLCLYIKTLQGRYSDCYSVHDTDDEVYVSFGIERRQQRQ